MRTAGGKLYDRQIVDVNQSSSHRDIVHRYARTARAPVQRIQERWAAKGDLGQSVSSARYHQAARLRRF